MLIFTFGTLLFGWCWQVIEASVEWIKFIKPTYSIPWCPAIGIGYAAEPSEHPE